MADEIRLRAPSVEQDIKVNVVGLEDITKLYKGLNKVTKSLKGLSEVKLDNINNFKLNDSLQNITKLADAVKVLRDAEESLNKTRKNAVGNSSSGTSVIAPKVDVSQFRNAKTVINDYFKLLKKVSSNADITKSHGVYTSQSGEYIKLATEMNVVSAAFEKLKNSMSSMPQTQQAELMGLITKKTRDFAISQEEAAQKAKHANDSMKAGTVEHASAVDALSKKLAQAEDTLRKFSAAETSTKSSSQLAYKTIQSCKSEYEALDAQLKNGSISYDTYKNKIAEINAKMSASVSVIKQNGDAHQKMGEKVKAAVEKFSQWLSVSTMVMLAVRNVKKMVTAVIELDTAMTELRKVTNETEETYSRFLNNAATRAKRTGATLADTVNATADFARLGYSLEEAEKLSDAAVIYKNVGDGIADINEASQSIISTMKAFNIEAGNAMFIVDKFNEVGNNFAISSKGIGDALLRSASAMAAANNTLDETIALITAANTIAQNPDSVGTTMKTVSMYLRAAKTEAEDAGESTEGMAESVSKLRDELLALTGGKVDIQIDEDTFKSTYQIMKELSQVWNELTDISQANILEKIGGKRNANVVAGIIENFEIAEKAMLSAQSAMGSATAENEKYLNSIKGHLNTFKVAFETLSKNLVDSAIIKFVVDLGTKIINVTNALVKLTNKLGGFKNVLKLTVALLAITNAELIKAKVIAAVTALWGKLKTVFLGVVNVLKKTITAIPNAIAAWKTYATTTATAAAKQAALSTAIQATIPVIGVLLAAITAVSAGMALASSKTSEAEEQMRKDMEETKQKAQETAQEASESVNEMVNAYSKYESAKAATDSLTGSTKELSEAREELVRSLNVEKAELDAAINKYQSYDEAIRQTLLSKLKLKDIDLRAGLLNSVDRDLVDNPKSYMVTPDYKAWQDKKDDVLAVQKAIVGDVEASTMDARQKLLGLDLDFQGVLSFQQVTGKNVVGRVEPTFWLKDATQDMKDAYGEMAQVIQAYRTYQDLLIKMRESGFDEQNVVYRDISNTYSSIAPSVEAYMAQVDALNDSLAYQLWVEQGIANAMPSTQREFNNTRKSLIDAAVASGDFSGSTDDVASAIDRLLKSQPGFKDFFKINSSESVSNLTDLSDAAQKVKTNYELLAKAKEDMAGGDGLSTDTIKALADANADYLSYLYEENGVIKLNTEAWREYCNVPVSESIEGIKQRIEALQQENEKLEEELEITSDLHMELGGLYSKVSSGHFAPEDTARIGEIESILHNIPTDIEENNKAIDEANSKLQIYEALWDQVIGKTDAYSQALQNFSTIHSFINQISDSLTTVADLQQTVANGFTLSLDKALEFASVYPEILNSATVSADGQIALNEGVVNAFIAGKHAEFQASIDAKIQELEGDKAALVAKMTFAQAQLDIAKSVGDGEGQITYDVAKYRMETAQTLVDALIQAGVDESEAYKTIAEAMANNTLEFDKVAADVCRDVDGNFSKASMNAATNIYNNMKNSAASVDGLTRAAQSAAQAIAGIAKGVVAGVTGLFGGASGTTTGSAGVSASAGNFKGVDPSKTSAAAQLQEMINDLEVDISSYQNAISQIDGQITALKALRDTPLSNFSSNNKSGGGGSGSGGRGSGSGSGSDSNSSEKEESWFEKEYKLHKHLLAMDAEEVSDYLTWLNDAYKRAYDEQIITLDDYRKHCEEVYSGLQSLFKDYLNDVEHEISMRENYEGESKKIVELYKTLISKVENEIASARVHGLDDDDDYIQELQKKWQTYTKYIKDLENKLTDSAKSALDKLVDYRINMIKKDVDAEKDALKKKLDALKKFYDKQKDMLKEQKDEEQYLEDQAEKRKSVTDIQEQLAQLANDNSAWAQKRKLELQKELVDAQKSLTDFEKDHAYDLATSALDKAYEAQEDEINKQMDALENMLNDPEALYNQALADIRDNSKNQLYYQMLMYNKRYGDGKDETVIKLWEETYGALDKYEQYFGKLLDGVKLENATGVEKDKSSWDTEKISGTGHTTGTAAPTTSGGGKTSPTSNKKDTTGGSETKSPASSSAPSLANGSTITVKKTATNFSSKSKNVKMASFVPGGQYTVYKTDGNEVLIGRNGVYTGWIKKTDIVGYASGTRNATAGLHAIDERGAETLFTSSDGTKYRMFSSGEKVLNAKASNFLYDFANSGGEILEKIIKSVFGGGSLDKIAPAINNTEVNMGNIIVQGNANERTVSEIRRVQREEVSRMLKEFGKLQK